jgi:Tfp pilus assembly protein PilF
MQSSDERTRLLRAIELLVANEPERALPMIVDALDKHPDDPAFVYMAGNLFAKADHYGLALHLYKTALNLAPQRPEVWNNYGKALQGLGRQKEARDAFIEARRRVDPANKVDRANYVANIALTYSDDAQREKAIEWAKKALAIDPTCQGAMQTIGFCSLALGNWKRGWDGYAKLHVDKYRPIVKVGDEPYWDGNPVDTLFVFGEQGIGDELMFASILPDAARSVGKVVLECDRRLGGLMSRSFPGVDVYATRKKAAVRWPAQYTIDAGIAIGDLAQFYRPSPDACPGTPYLVADPERRLQWRALLDSWGPRPKIGLCWSGGHNGLREKERRIALEAFRPLIESIDADYMSLQYVDPTDEIAATGLPVRHYARATLTDDYDDTAALVAELDLVIGVHTAVHHLAGGLGVPGIVLTPAKSTWIWALPAMPWYASARMFRQRDGEAWGATIRRLLASDSEYLDRVRSAGSRGVSRLRSVDYRTLDGAGGDSPARAFLADLVSEPS